MRTGRPCRCGQQSVQPDMQLQRSDWLCRTFPSSFAGWWSMFLGPSFGGAALTEGKSLFT